MTVSQYSVKSKARYR